MRALPRLALAALLAAAPLAVVTAAASAAEDPTPITVLTSDFEDGTVQGWTGRSAETVAHTTAVAHGGTGSLAVSGRTAAWEGPSLDVFGVFKKGTAYTVSAWVRMESGSDTARLSVERRTGGVAAYDQVSGGTAVSSGAWVNLTGRYTLATDVDFLRLYVETSSTTGPLHIDDVTASYVPALPVQTDIPAVKDVVTEFPVGVAITGAEIISEHGELLNRHFASVTPGNALKWDATEPSENTFTYAQADPLIAYAKANDLAIRGHTLVWHNQTPAWVFTGADGQPMTATAEDKTLLLARLENHIRNVAAHYGTDIGVWDVVNEVIDESQSDGLRRSTWHTVTGLDYIRTAFRVAREVAPHAKLFINDYNTNVPAKRDHLFTLVQRLRAEGVPIDGVGHQVHINVNWPTIAESEAMLAKFVPLGIEQQITEMDVSIYTNESENFATPPADRLLKQAYVYRDMFALFRRYAGEITSVTLWGLADDNTWLDTFPVTRKDAPLLFDTRLQAKSAYWGVTDPARIETSPSPSTPSSSTPTPPSSCAIAYRVTASWPGGFQGDVKITNTGAAPLTSWSLTWKFTGGQQIRQLWGGSHTQALGTVTVGNAEWNGSVAAGGSVSVGFLGSWTGANPAPAAFTVNGATCTVL
ncbi:endo-1,4-beta-xylanase [Actinoplanes sp. NEAU-A12]|uniref:Beta-xylanase n=1 Tax=Actinoplanes sandaracinus TaxID=3045177 RepID=A0ABT6X090_9ACTN|nr:endo-1,4-beta-xylanase [Actinoplanes sandaracinus]MDI6105418.1 endo-1,4-beta-xylanase [Actinoplanes sandaracinus]